jgi:hypothetical protein
VAENAKVGWAGQGTPLRLPSRVVLCGCRFGSGGGFEGDAVAHRHQPESLGFSGSQATAGFMGAIPKPFGTLDTSYYQRQPTATDAGAPYTGSGPDSGPKDSKKADSFTGDTLT